MDRNEVTEKIIETKIRRNITWSKVAEEVGKSKEWVTAGCLGQMAFSDHQAQVVGELFDLSPEEIAMLRVPPFRGSLPNQIPADPTIYRLYELVSVYGPTIKELIHEEFGDGIMSAIDFDMSITRQEDPNGDRVHIELSGKFLPYKSY